MLTVSLSGCGFFEQKAASTGFSTVTQAVSSVGTSMTQAVGSLFQQEQKPVAVQPTPGVFSYGSFTVYNRGASPRKR